MNNTLFVGLGGAFVDITVPIRPEELAALPLEGGGITMVPSRQQREFIKRFVSSPEQYSAGGSTANTLYALQKLGAKCHFAGKVGADEPGRFFCEQFEQIGLQMHSSPVQNGSTGTVLVFITPDGERTFSVDPGLNGSIEPADIPLDLVTSEAWLLLEGQLLKYSQITRATCLSLASVAAKQGMRMALGLGGRSIIREYRPALMELISKCMLVFANREEAAELCHVDSDAQACESLGRLCANYVLTAGSAGAYATWNGNNVSVPAFATRAIDTNGAGDAFAAGVLFGLTQPGCSLQQALLGSHYLAAKVVQQPGARLEGDARQYWDLALKGGSPH